MSVPGWVYKKMAMGDISPEEVEQLEKMAMLLIMPALKPLSELSDRQVKNRIIEQEMLRTPGTIGGAIAGGLAGGLLGKRMGRGGSLLGAAAGALGGGAMLHAANVAGTNRMKKTLERRKEYDAMDKQAFFWGQKPQPQPQLSNHVIDGYNREVDFLNRPENIDLMNQHAATYGSKKFNKSMKDMSDDELLEATDYAKYQILPNMHKLAQAVSPIGRAGANAAVADKSNNLQTVMKNVPAEDRDDVLRALRQMKKTASSYQPKVASATRSRLEKIAMGQLGTLGQMGILMGGAALAPVVGQLASAGINRLMQKSQAQIQQDLKRVLEVHPEIGRPEDPRVQMAYNSLVKLNPTYAEDPLIAGPLLKQIVESRMDPTNPMSNPIVDPGIAKNLSEARKSIREGDPRDTFGGAMGQSLSQGVQMATLGGLAAPGTPQGQPAPGGFFR